MPIKVLIADDHILTRTGIRTVLEAVEDFEVVGEAADGIEAIRLAERLAPDVVVLDLLMPSLNGMDALATIRKRTPHTKVVICSLVANDLVAERALEAGASGYVKKTDENSTEVLIDLVRNAGRGATPPVSAPLGRASRPHDQLTLREREVLQLAAEGNSNATIASLLHISRRTVEMHRARAMRKLGLRNLADLVRYAYTHRLIPGDHADPLLN